MRFKKTLKILCFVMAMCLTLGVLTACGDNGPKKVTVTVIDGEKKTSVEIETGKTVKDALDAARITLGDKDSSEPKPDAEITEDTKEITIKRAAQTKVSVTVDGKTQEIETSAATVEELLKEMNITLGEFDEVSEKLEAKLTAGMKIVIKRVEYKEVTEKESIDFETEEQTSDSLAEGTTEVTQEGVKGEKEVTYKVKYVDGKEESREKVSEKVIKEPVKKIITVGTYVDYGGGNDGGDTGDGRTIVSKVPMPDCDEDGHGTYIVTYDDGSVEFVEY